MLLCADYVLPVSSEPLFGGAVLVKDGAIADMGDAETLKLRYPDEEVRELGDAAIMPGLVDLHTHLENAVLRGVVHDVPYAKWATGKYYQASKLDTQDWADSAMVGGLQTLACGVTTVADISVNGAALNAISRIGLRGVIFREVRAMDADRVDFAVNAGEEEIDKWLQMTQGKPIDIGIAPGHLYDCHPRVFREVSRMATRKGLPVAIHVAGSREEYNFIKRGSSLFSVDRADRGFVEMPPWLPTGVSPMKYANNWDAFDAPKVMVIHGVHVDSEDIRIIADAGASVCVCPRSTALLGMGVAPVSDYLDAGVCVGFGTDSSATADSVDLIADVRLGMLISRATSPAFLSSDRALRMATLDAARALGLDDQVGSLEIGKRADIVAVDLSQTHQSPTKRPVSAVVNACSGSDVVLTMVDGDVLYDNGEFNVDVDLEASHERLAEIRARIRSK